MDINKLGLAEGKLEAKKSYTKPELVMLGTVGELTQSGGALHRDGVFTRKLS